MYLASSLCVHLHQYWEWIHDVLTFSYKTITVHLKYHQGLVYVLVNYTRAITFTEEHNQLFVFVCELCSIPMLHMYIKITSCV